MIKPAASTSSATDTAPLPMSGSGPGAPGRSTPGGGGAPDTGQRGPTRGRRRHPWLRRFAILVLIVAVAVAGLAVALTLATPSVANAPRRVSAILTAHHAPSDNGVLPPKVTAALVATEDSRFYHEGPLDPRGVVRAVAGFITRNPNAGGATITQQLAKMLYTPGRSGVLSELEQVALAFKLNDRYTKNQILAMYLNAAYFGDGAYGVTEASRHYFGRPAADLSWAQASLLAGLVQAPSAYDPHGHLNLAVLRQHHVLDRLVATGVLTKAAAAQAAAAPLHPAVPFGG